LANALVSFGVAIGGIFISYINWYWLNPAIGLVIMKIILNSIWSLLRDSFRITIDAAPSIKHELRHHSIHHSTIELQKNME
jgi:cobalt-zinc-cadmium efflux system protein